MSTIVTRTGVGGKGSPLTNTELDANFTNLNTDKLQLGQTFSGGTASALLFLDASKVLAQSSGLTFDGSANLFLSAVGAGYWLSSGGTYSMGLYQNGTSLSFRTNTINQLTIAASGAGTTTQDWTFQGVTVGRGAGAVSTNTAAGASALAANTSGGYNSAYGNFALAANTTGVANSAFGQQALAAGTTGSNNTAIGNGALLVNTTGGSNTAIGQVALASNTTASGGTAVGYQAGYSNTTGTEFVALGYQAGYTNSTGTVITALGYQALYSTNGATQNVAVGHRAGYTVTTGSYNTTVGVNSLRFATTGGYNTSVGGDALFNNTTANNNTAVGYQAGYNNTTGSVTALGQKALYSNTTGADHVAVGIQALYSNTTGAQNTAVGHVALNANTTGGYNTAIGSQALNSSTTASNNTAVGYQAGYNNTANQVAFFGAQAGFSNTTGIRNTAIGHLAMYSNTVGQQNSAVGTYALYNNTSGNYNVAMGEQAAYYLTTGSYNVVLGKSSLAAGTTTSYNVSIGYEAGYQTTTGADNVFIGYQAGRSNVTDQGQTFVGFQAGYSSNASTTSADNTCIGAYAGYSLTTGSKNTFVGGSIQNGGAGYLMTTGSKNTIIGGYNGNQGGLDIRTANNYIVLSDGDGNPRAYWDSAGILIQPGLTKLRSGYLNQVNYYEKLLESAYFTEGVANLAVDVRFGNKSFWGYIEIEITGTFSNQNVGGKLTKVFAVGTNPGGSIYVNESRAVDVMGAVNGGFTIGEFGWDSANSTYRIPIYHLTSLGNGIQVRVRQFTHGGSAEDVVGGVVLSSFYTSASIPAIYGTNFTRGIGIGGAAVPSSGYGVSFPATQSASSDANTLDDYEEGTWTPGFRGSGTSGTYNIQINSASGTYIKIGRQVTVLCDVTILASGYSAGTGYAQITGLPFLNYGQSSGSCYVNNVDLDAGCVWCDVEFISATNQSIVYLNTIRDNTSSLDTQVSGFTPGSTIRFTLTYFTYN